MSKFFLPLAINNDPYFILSKFGWTILVLMRGQREYPEIYENMHILYFSIVNFHYYEVWSNVKIVQVMPIFGIMQFLKDLPTISERSANRDQHNLFNIWKPKFLQITTNQNVYYLLNILSKVKLPGISWISFQGYPGTQG